MGRTKIKPIKTVLSDLLHILAENTRVFEKMVYETNPSKLQTLNKKYKYLTDKINYTVNYIKNYGRADIMKVTYIINNENHTDYFVDISEDDIKLILEFMASFNKVDLKILEISKIRNHN